MRFRGAALLPLLLAFALMVTACGEDDDPTAGAGSTAAKATTTGPDISDITSDPGDYIGDRVKLRGEVDEI